MYAPSLLDGILLAPLHLLVCFHLPFPLLIFPLTLFPLSAHPRVHIPAQTVLHLQPSVGIGQKWE